MKIVFIARFTRIWDEEPVASAFEQCGVSVVRIEERTALRRDILSTIEREKPDLVLFTKLNTPQEPLSLISEIKKMGVPTVSWTFDLLRGHPTRENMMGHFHWLNADYNFITDGGHDYGKNTFLLRQGISDRYNYVAKPDKMKHPYKVAFIGTDNSHFPARKKLMNELDDIYGSDFHWYGRFDAFEVRGDDLNVLCASVPVIVGCSMPSPKYWSNRLYEIQGRGGFMIFPEIEGLSKEYPKKALVTYKFGDTEDLITKIDYYLKNQEERLKIALNAFEHTRKHHLFTHRAKQFLTIWENLSLN